MSWGGDPAAISDRLDTPLHLAFITHNLQCEGIFWVQKNYDILCYSDVRDKVQPQMNRTPKSMVHLVKVLLYVLQFDNCCYIVVLPDELKILEAP